MLDHKTEAMLHLTDHILVDELELFGALKWSTFLGKMKFKQSQGWKNLEISEGSTSIQ